MKKYLFILMALCMTIGCSLSAEILESFDIRDLLKYADEETLVVTDIDQVLVKNADSLASVAWRAYDIKKQMEKTGKTKAEVKKMRWSLWHDLQKNSNYKAVESTTVGVIRKLQLQGNPVIGLTNREIEMADTTIKQLHSNNIDLSLMALGDLFHEIEGDFAAKYIKGIIFNGSSHNKGKTLMRFLDQIDYQPKRVLFIDDKDHHVPTVAAACEERGIPFVCLRYGYEDDATFDPVEAESALKAFLEKEESERARRISEADQQADQLV